MNVCCSFRQYWASLPWSRATFHTLSPSAISELATYMCSPDRVVLELLHSLDWRPVVQQLGNLHSQDPAVAREACRWAVQLVCLSLRAYILLDSEELPHW